MPLILLCGMFTVLIPCPCLVFKILKSGIDIFGKCHSKEVESEFCLEKLRWISGGNLFKQDDAASLKAGLHDLFKNIFFLLSLFVFLEGVNLAACR